MAKLHFRIRPYRTCDLEGMCAVTICTLQIAFLPKQPRHAIRELIAFFTPGRQEKKLAENIRENTICYLAEDIDGKIIGVIRGRPSYLLGLYVLPGYHGRDIGRRLLRIFEKACRRAGSQSVYTHAFIEAESFYARHGYKKTTGPRRSEGFWTRPMRKHLV
jgi:GNAT superfamily N-acetyltransferase